MNVRSFAPIVLRLGLAIVVMWFGFSELMNPSMWVSYIPTWLVTITGIKVATLVIINGSFEVLMALLMAFGIWTRWVALLLLIHMIGIVADVGLSAVGVRDVGLAFGLLSVTLQGHDSGTLHAPKL